MKVVNNLGQLERYKDIALAIGFVELLGNDKPNDKNINIAKVVVKRLGLSWEDCLNFNNLMKAMK